VNIDADWVSGLFTQNDTYRFARWGRPVVPVVFGVDDETLTHLKDGIAQTVGITGGVIGETDPELGANFMWFFCQNWDELKSIPNLEKLFPDFNDTIDNLQKSGANQYRRFAFDDDGGIQLCVVLLRMDDELAAMSIQTLATSETLQALLIWGDRAFADTSPIAIIKENGICIVKPEFAAVVRAAYSDMMPVAADDASHALRLAARAGMLLQDLADDS